jgi:hypothetical protein
MATRLDQKPACDKQIARIATLIRSRRNPATLLSLTVSIALFAYVIFGLEIRDIAEHGEQGGAAVGYSWLVFAWLFPYLPLTAASLVTTPRKERGFAYFVMLFPWGMMILIAGFIALYRANM